MTPSSDLICWLYLFHWAGVPVQSSRTHLSQTFTSTVLPRVYTGDCQSNQKVVSPSVAVITFNDQVCKSFAVVFGAGSAARCCSQQNNWRWEGKLWVCGWFLFSVIVLLSIGLCLPPPLPGHKKPQRNKQESKHRQGMKAVYDADRIDHGHK